MKISVRITNHQRQMRKNGGEEKDYSDEDDDDADEKELW